MNKEHRIILAVESGDSISIQIERKQRNTTTYYVNAFYGSNHAAHQAYNDDYFPPGINFEYFDDISKSAKDHHEYFRLAKHYIDSLNNEFDFLSANNQTSNRVRALYLADIKANLYGEATRKLSKVIRDDNTYPAYIKWFKTKSVMYHHGDAANTNLLRTMFGSRLHNNYLASLLLEDPTLQDSTLKNSDFGFYYYYPNKLRELAWGNALINIQNFSPNEILGEPYITPFAKIYPQSNYLQTLQSFADSLINARRASGAYPKIHLERFDSVKQYLMQLQGRYFFIDVWATWCLPCIQEFKTLPELSRFLSENKVVQVMFSVDKQADSNKWQSFIQKNYLPGNHFLLSKISQQQLAGVINGSQNDQSFSIPQYIFYDKELDQFYLNLPRPSEFDRLKGKINGFLK